MFLNVFTFEMYLSQIRLNVLYELRYELLGLTFCDFLLFAKATDIVNTVDLTRETIFEDSPPLLIIRRSRSLCV